MSETERLLDSSDDVTATKYYTVPSGAQQSRPKKAKRCRVGCLKILRSITVEPVAILCVLVFEMYWMIAKEYIYYRLAKDHNLTTTDRDTSCNDSAINKSDPQYILQQEVASETSKWFLCFAATDFSVAIFTTFLLGAWSDKVGRKIPMLISSIGPTILMLTYVFVVHFNLPIQILLVGHFLSGLSGDFCCVLACAMAYISDITKREDRTFRMAIIGACLGPGSIVASLAGGAWVDKQGFLYPLCFLLIICIVNDIYICIRLKSTHEGSWARSIRELFTKEPFLHMYRVLKPQPVYKRRHIHLMTYVVCFLLMFMSYAGVQEILIVYVIGPPFCMNPLMVGITQAIAQVGFFVTIFMVKIFPGVSSELKLVMLSIVSSLSSTLVLAFSKEVWMIFLGVSIRLFFHLPAPIMRSQASLLVEKNEVGSVFSLLSFSTNFGNVLTALIFDGVFSLTVQTAFPGAAFFISVGLIVIYAPLYCWVFGQTKHILMGNKEDAQLLDEEET